MPSLLARLAYLDSHAPVYGCSFKWTHQLDCFWCDGPGRVYTSAALDRLDTEVLREVFIYAQGHEDILMTHLFSNISRITWFFERTCQQTVLEDYLDGITDTNKDERWKWCSTNLQLGTLWHKVERDMPRVYNSMKEQMPTDLQSSARARLQKLAKWADTPKVRQKTGTVCPPHNQNTFRQWRFIQNATKFVA